MVPPVLLVREAWQVTWNSSPNSAGALQDWSRSIFQMQRLIKVQLGTERTYFKLTKTSGCKENPRCSHRRPETHCLPQ